MSDQDGRIDERIARAAQELYHVPPATPREDMWSAIQCRLDADPTPVVPIQRKVRRISGLTWWIGIAAALVIGLGLGRLSMAPTPAGDAAVEIANGPGRQSSVTSRSSLPYVLATREHLNHAESLLMMVRSEQGADSSHLELETLARSLLSRTRLLLGTPATEAPDMRALLEDLELMLMQIVATTESGDPEEARILDQGLDEGNLLRRIRSVNSKKFSPARGL